MNTNSEQQSELNFAPISPSRIGEQMELDFTETVGLSVFSNATSAMLTFTPIRNVTFHGETGRVVGTLSWDDGPMIFAGDADESARKFFECVIKNYCKWTGISPTP